MDFDIAPLLKAVDLIVIIAIIGITEAIKAGLPESYWRWVPGIPLVLGVAAGVIMSPAGSEWRVMAKAALLYGGAASLTFELLRTTILKSGSKIK